MKNVKIINELIEQLANLKNEIKSWNTTKHVPKKIKHQQFNYKLNDHELIPILKITDLENKVNIEKIIQALKETNPKTIFNRTEYDHDRDR